MPAKRNGAEGAIREELLGTARLLESTAAQAEIVARMSRALIEALKRGRKILTFGNGGSACDAQNFADELVGRFDRNRPPLSAIALTTNTSDLTSISNDFGFEHVFERQVEAHAKEGDVAVAISTSGNSPNVILGAQKARDMGLLVLGFTGQSGGKLKPLCDLCLCVPSVNVARIQNVHITAIQAVCGIVEETLFPDAPKAH
jgi:D-sedoheptulose 7-phosphate isomerase